MDGDLFRRPAMNDVVLTITLSPNGQIGVNGPIDNKILCMGMLELTKDVILKYEHKAIQVAAALPKVVS